MQTIAGGAGEGVPPTPQVGALEELVLATSCLSVLVCVTGTWF